jgi:hypothetical protein
MALTTKSHALSACRRLLGPVARLLLRSGITWRDFAELSKAVFVDVATRDFGLRGRPTNLARVALMTGINRRDVSRIREAAATAEMPAPTYLNAAQRVLSGWHQDPEYLDAMGTPMPLAPSGSAPCFESLCRRFGGDMPATALLRELRHVGAVGDTPDGRLQALSRSYIQARLDPEKTLRAGSVLEDLGNTIVYDLTAPDSRRLRFERRAENDAIDPKHIAAFQEFLEHEGMAFLERVDAWLTCHQVDPNAAPSTPRVRLGAGLFHIEDAIRKGSNS